VSVREILDSLGFPDNYRVLESHTSQLEQARNSIAVPVARFIANVVLDHLRRFSSQTIPRDGEVTRRKRIRRNNVGDVDESRGKRVKEETCLDEISKDMHSIILNAK
jgi:C-5 cytosine-specific DNA methylase